MPYTLKVTVEVVNEDGEVVDFRGYSKASYRPPKDFFGLTVPHEVQEYKRVEDAHIDLNNIHAVVKTLSAFRKGT